MVFAIDTGVESGQGSLVRRFSGRLASSEWQNEQDHPAAGRILPERAISLAAECARQMTCSCARRNKKARELRRLGYQRYCNER